MIDTQIVDALAAAPSVPHVIADDGTPAIVIQYVPTLGTGGATATLTYTKAATGGTLMVLIDSASATGDDAFGGEGYCNIVDDADIDHDGLLNTSCASVDTCGELVDYINSLRAYRAYLVAALRADSTSLLKSKTAASIMGENGLTLYFENASFAGVGTAISGEKFVNNGKAGHVTDWDSKVVNEMLYANILVTDPGTASDYFRIYDGKAGVAETKIYDYTLTSGTAKDFNAANLDQAFVKATMGHRLIIRGERGSNDTALTSIGTFQVLGRSGVVDGSRIVDEDNF